MENNLTLNELNNILRGKTIVESLKILVSLFPGEVIFTTSFGIEDQVLTHIIFENDLPVEIVTLDTGRLFPETYKVFSDTVARYRKKINILFPNYTDIEKMVSEKGPFSFFESKENRIECCKLRKILPLNRPLRGKKCWISGIRAYQSDNRSQMSPLEWDEDKKLFKYHPLFKWTLKEVETFIKENGIPYNSLHEKGFVSIGCEPCTRAINPGEDFRAGRWWWEKDEIKECGCHVK